MHPVAVLLLGAVGSGTGASVGWRHRAGTAAGSTAVLVQPSRQCGFVVQRLQCVGGVQQFRRGVRGSRWGRRVYISADGLTDAGMRGRVGQLIARIASDCLSRHKST